jgi:predicted nucleic acid-binding protein
VILVDASAWADFFSGGRLAGAVDEALEDGLVSLCGPVLTQLGRGLQARSRGKVLALLEGCTLLDAPSELWVQAGDLGFALARHGAQVKPLNLLVAVYALTHDQLLLSAERDFRLMAKARVPLRLVAA